MGANVLKRIRWGSEIADEMEAVREVYDLREAEREQYHVHPAEAAFWSQASGDTYSPLSGQAKNVLNRVNRSDTPIPSALDSLKAAVFARYRVEGTEQKLTPKEVQSFMAQAVIELADLFDDVDHMLFDGSPDGRGGVIMGGTDIQDKAQKLRETSRDIFSTQLGRIK